MEISRNIRNSDIDLLQNFNFLTKSILECNQEENICWKQHPKANRGTIWLILVGMAKAKTAMSF